MGFSFSTLNKGLSQGITALEDKLGFKKVEIYSTSYDKDSETYTILKSEKISVPYNPATVRYQYTKSKTHELEKRVEEDASGKQKTKERESEPAQDDSKQFEVSFDLFFDYTGTLYDGTEMTGWLAGNFAGYKEMKEYADTYDKTYGKFEKMFMSVGTKGIVFIKWGNTFVNYYDPYNTESEPTIGLLGTFNRVSSTFDFFDGNGNPRKIRSSMSFIACPTLKYKEQL